MRGFLRQHLTWGMCALVALATILGVTLAHGASQIHLTDVTAPRGLSTGGSYLLVADQGNGRILRVSPQGTVTVIAEGITAESIDSPEGPTWVGVTSVIDAGGTYYYTVGGAFSAGGVANSAAVYAVTPGQTPRLIADLGAYENAHNRMEIQALRANLLSSRILMTWRLTGPAASTSLTQPRTP
jgi:hypothetical protein